MKKIITALIFAIMIFASCEDVIDIELNTTEPKLVVEGAINDNEQCTIKLSKTGDYFNPSIYPAVSEAVITITENNKDAIVLTETESGIYTADLQGVENTSYTLSIVSEGKEYTANVTIPYKVSIDSLSFIPSPPSPRFDEGLMVNCHFHEPEEFTNYYRLKAYKKGDTMEAKGTMFVFTDDMFSGNNVVMPWSFEVFQPFDTIVVELQTLDKSTYDYLNTLSGIAGSSGKPPIATSTPANPETNLSNEALGYFGAYTLSKDTIAITFPF